MGSLSPHTDDPLFRNVESTIFTFFAKSIFHQNQLEAQSSSSLSSFWHKTFSLKNGHFFDARPDFRGRCRPPFPVIFCAKNLIDYQPPSILVPEPLFQPFSSLKTFDAQTVHFLHRKLKTVPEPAKNGLRLKFLQKRVRIRSKHVRIRSNLFTCIFERHN